MRSHMSYNLLLFFSLAATGFAAFPNPPTFTVDSNNSPIFDDGITGILRDGGGSGMNNGFKTIAFSDTFKYESDGSTQFFQSSSFTYFGYSNPSDPRNQYDLGDNGHYGPGVYLNNSPGDVSIYPGDRVAIWPSSNIVAYNSTHSMASAELVDNHSQFGLTSIGNTWFSVEMTAYGILVDRVVDRAYTQDEVHYGNFSLLNQDGYMYLFADVPAATTPGIRVARVPIDQCFNKSYFKYWDGSSWADTAPAISSSTANIFNYKSFEGGAYTGDIFYDNYHQSLACIFMESYGGTFHVTWPSNSTDPTSGWATPVELASYQPSVANDLVYAGHAHPEWDTTGKSLLMSYSDGSKTRRMVSLAWNS